MEPRKVKLGDVIDDYCTRCRLLMNHGVVGMVGAEVRKVRCLTCMFEHPFRHARLPKKRDTKKALFEKVRKGMQRESPGVPPGGEAPPVPSGGEEPGTEEKEEPEVDQVENGEEEPAARFPSQPAFRKPRSHSLAAQRGVQKGKPFGGKGGRSSRKR